MKILVTGGAGFIGSHLVELLLANGHEPIVVDNLSTGRIANVLKEVEFHQMDCRDEASLKTIARKCEYVYHAASTVGVEEVLDNPVECIENIIDSTRSVLTLGIPGMDFSTSEVYGKNTNLLSEDSDNIYSSKTRWSYAASKLIGEWLVTASGWKTIRLFNVIGPRQIPGYVFSNFIKQARKGEPITVYGTGEQVRTFIDVRDTVKILDILRDKSFDVVNVGAAHTLSVMELAKTIKQVLNSPSTIQIVPYNSVYSSGFDECTLRIPNLTKLHELIGEYNYLPIGKTIRETYE